MTPVSLWLLALAASLPLASAGHGCRRPSELAWMEVVVLKATSTVDETYSGLTQAGHLICPAEAISALTAAPAEQTLQIVAAQTEAVLSEGRLVASDHLTDLTYVPGALPGLVDTRPGRTSEFAIGNVAYDGDDEDPTLSASIGGACGCRAEWEALCNATRSARGGAPCLACARACEGLLFMRATDAMSTAIVGLGPYNPLSSGWIFKRAWRADTRTMRGRDFARAFTVMPWTASTGVYAWTGWNSTVYNSVDGQPYPMLSMSDGLAPFDRAPRWSPPYVLTELNLVMNTCGVAIWTQHGELFGTVHVDLAMDVSKALFLNLTIDSPVPVLAVMAQSSGAVVATPESTEAVLWGSCPGKLCNVFALSPEMEQIAQMSLGYSEYVDVVIGGRDYIVFAQNLQLGWKLWFFCLRSDAFPHVDDRTAMVVSVSVVVPVAAVCAAFAVAMVLLQRRMQKRVRDLEATLGSVASANVIGTPAEDAIKMLLEVQRVCRMPRQVRGDMNKVVALIASNKLFKADSNLREKLQEFHLETEVNDFLVNVLATETQKHSGECMEAKTSSTQMAGLALSSCQDLDAAAARG
eukprot:m51a1_g10821 hypothetical protein (580) ;mRNA; r:112-2268